MTEIAKKLEELLIDITFAEDRDFPASAKRAGITIRRKIEDTFTAVAFAEAGEFEAAATYLNKDGELARSPRADRTVGRFGRPCAGRA